MSFELGLVLFIANLNESECREWCFWRRLDDRGAACSQGRTELPSNLQRIKRNEMQCAIAIENYESGPPSQKGNSKV